MRKSTRVIFKPKVYGFNPWADQMPAIKQIMEELGQESEAPVLRMLIDEALRARRRKAGGTELPEPPPPPTQDLAESFQTILAILLKMIGQEQTTLRIQSLSLELLQETLAEARAVRLCVWESLVVPVLRQQGDSSFKIAGLFEGHTEIGKDFAYGVAEEIRDQLLPAEADKGTPTASDEERQGLLFYDDSHSHEDKNPQAA